MTDLDRRTALSLAATAAVGVPLVAACGAAPDATGTVAKNAGGPAGIQASKIPVGEGEIFPDQKIVVTQPVAGDFKAFSAVCTHQGCIVSSVSGGQIHCGCHGSAFSIKDGSVVGGPAKSPLAAKTVTDKGGELTVS